MAARIQLHLRAPPATRIETTEQIFQRVENKYPGGHSQDDVDLIATYWPACPSL